MKVCKIIMFIMACLPAGLANAESYLCMDELVTGFRFTPQTGWREASFKAEGKHVIKPSINKGEWIVVRVGGSADGVVYCASSFDDSGEFRCNSYGTDFLMNKKNLRFLMIHTYGYWSDPIPGEKTPYREGDDNPAIAIGKCVLLER